MEQQKELRKLYIVFALLFSVSLVIGDYHYHGIDKPNLDTRLKLHTKIIDGTAESPYRYRILVPFVMEHLAKTLPQFIPANKRFLLSYLVYDITVVFFMLGLLFVYLRLWFPAEQSLIGVLFVSSTMIAAMKNHYYQPWSFLDASFFTLGLLAIFKKKYVGFAFLVVLATLNRATAIFLPLTYLLISINTDVSRKYRNTSSLLSRQDLFRFLVYFALWLTVFIGLRWILGQAGSVHTIRELWALNTTPARLLYALINNSIFLGLFWLFAVRGFGCAPIYVRKTVRIVPLYILVIAVYGVWHEVRLLMTLYPILVPLGLSFIYRKKEVGQTN